MNGQIIKKQRQLLKLTLRELEAKSGVSASTISRLERNHLTGQNTSVSALESILEALEISLSLCDVKIGESEANYDKTWN